MLQLKNDCSCSEPSVYPKNWLTGGKALLKKTWYIQYYFRDPKFIEKNKYGKLVIIKRFSEYKDLDDRREAIEFLLKNTITQLVEYDYNPYTKTRIDPVDDVKCIYEIDPSTPFTQALEQALKKITIETETRWDMKSVLKYTGIAAHQAQE